MSILACDGDPVALGVVVSDAGRLVWDLEALGAHMRGCRACTALDDALQAVRAAHAGRAGCGATKRRGDAGYYRTLAGKRNALRLTVKGGLR